VRDVSLANTRSSPGNLSNVAAMNNTGAHQYSNLLLHHVAPRLADGIAQGRVAVRVPTSEANLVIDRFDALSPTERQSVLNFLRSL
jgi:hypothetical protein